MTPSRTGSAPPICVSMPYIRSQIDRIPDIEEQLRDEAMSRDASENLSRGVEKLHVLRQLVTTEDSLFEQLLADSPTTLSTEQRAEALQKARAELELTAARTSVQWAAYMQLKARLFPSGDEEMKARARMDNPEHNQLFAMVVEWRRLKAQCVALEVRVQRLQ